MPLTSLEVAIDARKARQGAIQLDAAMAQVRGGSRLTRDELGRFQTRVNSAGDSLKRMALSAKGLVAGFAGFLIVRQAITDIAQFDQRMATLQAVTDSATQDMQEFSEATRVMGATTRFGALQASEAMITLAKAGFTATQSIKAAVPVMQLAASELISLDVAADLVVGTLGQFRLSVEEASRVTDVLITASKASNTSAEELGLAFKFAGAVASSFGVSLEQTAAAMSALADANIRGALAGTAFRAFLSLLADPTREAREELEKYGLSLKDVSIQSRGLLPVLDTLSKANLSTVSAMRIFNREAAPGALTLIKSVDRVRQIQILADAAAGSTQQYVKILDQSLPAAFGRFKAAFQEVSLAVGQSGVAGALRGLLNTATDFLRAFSPLDEVAGATSERMRLLAYFTRQAFLGVVALTSYILVSGVVSLLRFAGALDAVNARLALLTKGFLLIAAAIGAFNLGGYFYDEFRSVQEGMARLIRFFQNGWDDIVFWAKVAAAGIKSVFFTVFEEIRAPFQMTLDKISIGLTVLEARFGKKFGAREVSLASTALSAIVPDETFGAAFNRISAENKTAREKNEALFQATIADIAREFEDNRRKGNSFYEFLLNKVKLAAKDAKQFAEGPVAQPPPETPGIIEDVSAETGRLRDRVKELSQELELELTLVGKTNDERERAIKLAEFMGVATEAYKDDQTELNQQVERYRSLLEQLQQLRVDETIRKTNLLLDDQIELQSKSAFERRNATDIAEFQRLVEEQYGKQTEKSIRLIDIHKQKLKELEDAKRLTATADQIAESFGQAFEDVILKTQDLGDAIEGLITDIQRALLRQFVTQPLVDLASTGVRGLLGAFTAPTAVQAMGGAYGYGGSVQAFAQGGVVGSPSLFGYGGGQRIGLMGESGPEAIMPLQRMPDGSLGVSSAGTSRTTVNVTIVTQDASSFRKSKNQVAATIASSLQKAKRRT